MHHVNVTSFRLPASSMHKHSFDIWSPQLRNRRYVDVYLPESYDGGRRRYPSVYMQDGQNLSDPAIAFGGSTWHLDEGLPWLAARGIEPIIVGIHNAGAERLAEYSPFEDPTHGGGGGDRYVRFLIDTVKPRIDATYRTRKDRAGTVIAGSSMGGLISLYAFFRRPSPFGAAAVISPSVWFGAREILSFVQHSRLTSGRIYLDVGTNEGAGTLRDARTLHRLLRRKGYKGDALRYLEAQGHQHREDDWAWRLPQALDFLLRARQ
jgi:predicted alpha/beta superfamily hydrolase